MEIDFPPSYSGSWTATINSDDAKIFGGVPSKEERVVLRKCVSGVKHR